VKKNVAIVAATVSRGTEAAYRTTKSWFSKVSGDSNDRPKPTDMKDEPEKETNGNNFMEAKLQEQHDSDINSRLQSRLKEKLSAHKKSPVVKKSLSTKSMKNQQDLKQVDAQLKLALLNTDQESLAPIISMVQALKDEDFLPEEYSMLMKKIQESLKELGVPDMEFVKVDAYNATTDNITLEKIDGSVEGSIVDEAVDSEKGSDAAMNQDSFFASKDVDNDTGGLAIDFMGDKVTGGLNGNDYSDANHVSGDIDDLSPIDGGEIEDVMDSSDSIIGEVPVVGCNGKIDETEILLPDDGSVARSIDKKVVQAATDISDVHSANSQVITEKILVSTAIENEDDEQTLDDLESGDSDVPETTEEAHEVEPVEKVAKELHTAETIESKEEAHEVESVEQAAEELYVSPTAALFSTTTLYRNKPLPSCPRPHSASAWYAGDYEYSTLEGQSLPEEELGSTLRWTNFRRSTVTIPIKPHESEKSGGSGEVDNESSTNVFAPLDAYKVNDMEFKALTPSPSSSREKVSNPVRRSMTLISRRTGVFERNVSPIRFSSTIRRVDPINLGSDESGFNREVSIISDNTFDRLKRFQSKRQIRSESSNTDDFWDRGNDEVYASVSLDRTGLAQVETDTAPAHDIIRLTASEAGHRVSRDEKSVKSGKKLGFFKKLSSKISNFNFRKK
jgi:hypothetical protein